MTFHQIVPQQFMDNHLFLCLYLQPSRNRNRPSGRMDDETKSRIQGS